MGVAIGSYSRIVLKVGSSLLVGDDGRINESWLRSLAADVRFLRESGAQVIVVSSGAIAVGCRQLNLVKQRARLEELQAAAAMGQVELASAYRAVMDEENIATAQILLTPGDTEDRRRFLNARSTLTRLLDFGIVPVVNENDTVATEEIRYGDNDRLAARVAQLVMADGLILLSDVDGLYDADPRLHPDAVHIAEVDTIDEEILSIAGESRSDVGTGGMATKVRAARIALHAGCDTIIGDGNREQPVHALSAGARCTIFKASTSPAAARKQWLAGYLNVRGEMHIDDGAAHALSNGNSLLPVGLVNVIGEFDRGDVVSVVGQSGDELGRGLTEYSDDEARRLRGCQSADIESVLGYRGRSVVIHRDELVLFQ